MNTFTKGDGGGRVGYTKHNTSTTHAQTDKMKNRNQDFHNPNQNSKPKTTTKKYRGARRLQLITTNYNDYDVMK